MWTQGWRDRTWSQLDSKWDLIVIGGGITGAGILREATRGGLKALLVEAEDFASGTSSRSSKLVHGGFRYLKNAQLKLTLESVGERERLLSQGKGLINRLGFLFTVLKTDPMPGWVFHLGLIIYDLMAGHWSHRSYDALDMRELCPPLTTPDLRGGYRYFDAQTDDARLVLRVIREAVRDGGTAINYAPAIELLRTDSSGVCGVVLRDAAPEGDGRTIEVQAPVVISATGAWADKLRTQIGQPARLRPLRGSHLLFPSQRLPITRAVSVMHPRDGRPVYAFPWEGVVLIGTTDVDQGPDLQVDPAISQVEAEYLLEFVQRVFPEQELSFEDVITTFSGIRAVVDTGKADPSKESREHVIWEENGLLTISGGKLTTFRVMARDALHAARQRLPDRKAFDRHLPVLDPVFEEADFSTYGLKPPEQLRLYGRYAADAPELLHGAQADELTPIEDSPYLWSELRWAARAEGVHHLDDLLLRRVRLGLLLPSGGLAQMARIRAIAQPELGWNDARWESELERYTSLRQRAYQL